MTEIARCQQSVRDGLVEDFRNRVDALFSGEPRVGRELEQANFLLSHSSEENPQGVIAR